MKPFYIANKLNLTLIVLTVLVNNVVKCDQECPLNLKLLCQEKESCDECVRAHPCCQFCYDQNFSGIRCNFLEELSECSNFIEKNVKSEVKIELNQDFNKIKKMSDVTKVIQMKPQEFRVTLRKDTPINVTFIYNAAKNYPLELYYLGDLSYSMSSHLATLKSLGDDLGNSLEKLTENYRLAYGSFLDKPGMPFYYTDDRNKDNPCISTSYSDQCEKGYLFKHRLSFTKNTSKFFEKVQDSKISANVDNLDGALEAIHQILVCNKRFGWTDYSRKIILLSTDSLLHMAGDGILVGAVLRNTNRQCLVNHDGNHTDPFKYDYPSLGEIKELLQDYKVNLILAVTEERLDFYRRMKSEILNNEAYVGELRNNSANILKLVNTGFYNFMKQVQFSTNTSHAPELDVKFFGDCYGGDQFNDTSACYNIEEETPVQFKLQLTLKEFTTKKSEHIYVKERNINEEITIGIDYAGCSCDCLNYAGESLNCGDHGMFTCGSCKCEEGWTGTLCSEECTFNVTECRKSEFNNTCSGFGECICGKCECEPSYSGKFCEYNCPTDRYNRICGDHGTCFEGECTCNPAYSGKDCSCETSVEKCKLIETGSICNNHGACECNTCQCEVGFEGSYCEKTKEKNVFCDIYEKYVQDAMENKTMVFVKTLNGNKMQIMVEDSEVHDIDCVAECSTVYFSGTAQRCLLDYCYHGSSDNSIHLVTKNKKCIMTDTAMITSFAISIFFAIIVGGIIMILLKKYQIYRLDQAEYKRFINEQKNFNELNPLYKSPVTEFRNPMLRTSTTS